MTTLFEPVSIGRLNLRNRMMRSATAERMADPETGAPLPKLRELYCELAEGGVGLIEQVGSYLVELISNRGVVLLLEDLHWADQGTISLLEYMTRTIEHVPLLLLATYRSDEVDQDHPLYPYLLTLQRDRPTATIRLTEFDQDDTTRFITSHLGPCTPELVQYLHHRSDGHPLFLVELLDDLVEQNILYRDVDDRWAPPDQNVPIPTLLRQVISQRVARLGQRSETFLDAAAVIGEVWMLSVVEALLDWPEEQLLDELDNILSVQIVEADDERGERYRFRHGLIKEALYRRQIPRRRRHLHARIGGLIEADIQRRPGSDGKVPDEFLGELAYHYSQAERWPEAYSFGREAAERAYEGNAPREVLRYGRQALMAFEQQPDVATAEDTLNLHEQLGQAFLLLGRKDEALDSFTHMLEVANGTDDRARVANALLRLAEAQERTYEIDQSEQARNAASDLVIDGAAPKLLARFHWAMAHHHMVAGGLETARRHLTEAERQARAGNDEEILINSELHQAYLAIFQASYPEAERLIQDFMAQARAAANMPRLAQACWQLGFVLTERGAYGRAQDSLLEGLEQADSIGENHYTLVRIRNSLGYLFRELGDLESAMRWNQEALNTNRQDSGSRRAIECGCYSLIDLAANCLAAGQIEASEGYFRDFEAVATGATYARYRYFNRAQLFLSELALARNEYDLAYERADQAMEIAERETMRKNMVRGMYFQGRALCGLNRLQEAARQLQLSVDLADEIGHAGLRWKTRLALADVYALSGQDDAGPLQRAQAVVKSIAEKLDEQSLRDVFLNSPQVLALQARIDNRFSSAKEESQSTEVRPAGLTRREVEVLKLIAAGLTDRQIGEQLYITVRTVNTHVTNILNKTACRNRTAAATFAAQHGLIDTGK